MGERKIALNANVKRNDIQAGVYGFAQHQYNYFFNDYTDGTPNVPPLRSASTAVSPPSFINDKFKVTPVAHLDRRAYANRHSSSTISANATDPASAPLSGFRALNWVFRGFYGYFYQAPPLSTANQPNCKLWPAVRASPSLRCTVSATSSGNSARPSLITAGLWTPTTSKPAPKTGSITTISASRISSGPSLGITT